MSSGMGDGVGVWGGGAGTLFWATDMGERRCRTGKTRPQARGAHAEGRPGVWRSRGNPLGSAAPIGESAVLMGEIAAFVQRTALALLMGLAPWAVALESPTFYPGTETRVLLSYGAPLLAYIVAATLLLSKGTLEGVMALGALAAAGIGALYFDGLDGPLGLVVWVVAPMILATAGFLVHAGVSLVKRGLPQAPFVVAAFLVGAVNFWMSKDFLFTREAMLTRVLAADPTNERAAVQLAELVRGEGEGARAEKILDTCAEARPAGCTCVSADIQSLDDRGSTGAARKIAEQNLPRCAHDRRLSARYAEALAGMGEAEKALSLIEELRKGGTDFPELWLAEARARRWKRDLDGALMAAREAVKRQRGFAASMLAAEILFERGDDVGARAEISPVLQRHGKNLRVLYMLGRIAHHEKNYAEARLKYERLLELSPKHIDAHSALAALAIDEGNAVEAVHHAHQIRLLAPEDPRPGQIEAAAAALSKRKK